MIGERGNILVAEESLFDAASAKQAGIRSRISKAEWVTGALFDPFPHIAKLGAVLNSPTVVLRNRALKNGKRPAAVVR
jgi:hypothetical protein